MLIKQLNRRHKTYPKLLVEIATPPNPLYLLGKLAGDKPTVASAEEAVILELLGANVTDSEELIARSGWEATKFNHVITLMEISGKVRNLGGGKWISR